MLRTLGLDSFGANPFLLPSDTQVRVLVPQSPPFILKVNESSNTVHSVKRKTKHNSLTTRSLSHVEHLLGPMRNLRPVSLCLDPKPLEIVPC